MKRYILSETIRRFEQILADNISEDERRYAAAEIAAMQRELALLDAAFLGAQKYPHQFGQASPSDKVLFQRLIEGSTQALLIIDPRPGLHIVDMTPAFAAATLAERGKVAGDELFCVFPDNPERQDADGVTKVFNSFRAAADSGDPHAMTIQRYDVCDGDGHFVERYWRSVNTPILNEAGELVWLMNRLEDVTALSPA
jgi:PAS domain-containing protein